MENTFQYKNIDVSYQVFGKGRAVVLLHGFLQTKTSRKYHDTAMPIVPFLASYQHRLKVLSNS